MPRCDQGPSAITVQIGDSASYFAAGGQKGKGVPAIADGNLEMVEAKGRPKYVKSPYLAFLAKRVKYERPTKAKLLIRHAP